MVSIGDYCFENCPLIVSVTIPPNVISVGRKAFALRNDTEFTHTKNFSVTCQKNSHAYDYCRSNGIVPIIKDFNMLFLVGDLNGNGKIEISDARTVLRFWVGVDLYTQQQKFYSDFNGSGKLDINDARGILRTAVGLES